MLYSKEYVVLLRCSCVRLVKPLACFRGVMFGKGFWGSEAFFLRYVLGLGVVGLGSLLGRILCRVVLLLVRVELYPN